MFCSFPMQHRKTPTGEAERGEAADRRCRLSMNSLESLYSLTSRQSSSSKHPKAGGQMHSSHTTLMNYATPLRHSHFTPPLTSDKAKPNPQLVSTTGPSYFGNVDCQRWKSILTQMLICFRAAAKVESQAPRTTSVTETV